MDLALDPRDLGRRQLKEHVYLETQEFYLLGRHQGGFGEVDHEPQHAQPAHSSPIMGSQKGWVSMKLENSSK